MKADLAMITSKVISRNGRGVPTARCSFRRMAAATTSYANADMSFALCVCPTGRTNITNVWKAWKTDFSSKILNSLTVCLLSAV